MFTDKKIFASLRGLFFGINHRYTQLQQEYRPMSRKKVRTIRLTWIVLSVMSAFVLGLYFKPGTPGGKRLPPRLTREQMMNRMPRQMVMPGQMQRIPMQRNQMPVRQLR